MENPYKYLVNERMHVKPLNLHKGCPRGRIRTQTVHNGIGKDSSSVYTSQFYPTWAEQPVNT